MQAAVPTGAYELPQLPDIELVETPRKPRGKRWFPPLYTGEPRQVSISPRMADVLVGSMKGRTAKQIGKSLFLTEDTVKTHARRLYQALGARDRAHAVALFVTGEVEVYVTDRPAQRRRLGVLTETDER